MLRSSLVAAGAALLCAVASAQNVDLSRVYPITGAVKDAGVYDMKTGKFYSRTQASALGAAQQVIYNNTCTWSGGAFYTGAEFCDDMIDEGRVPASGPAGATATNATNTWEIAYCTFAVTGTVDVDWEVYDTASGSDSCTFGSAGLPPPFTAGLVGFDSSAAGLPLPGSTAVGSQACWIVTFTTTTPVCMNSGATSNDLFNWRFRQNNTPVQSGGLPNGPILSGEPSIPGGSGTYNIPPGIDPIFGNTCGHGLDSQDLFWINVDNTPVGGVPPAACVGSPGAGTNCYWFGGYPTNPFAGLYFRMESAGSCASCTGSVANYCTAKVNSLGCTPVTTFAGVPKVATPSGFVLTASKLVGNKNGLWFYGTNGLQGAPFQGGFLCVKAPIKRLNVQNSGGQGTACNGVITTDFNARIFSGIDPALVAGKLVGAQCWSRDPASPSTTNLTGGVQFTICP